MERRLSHRQGWPTIGEACRAASSDPSREQDRGGFPITPGTRVPGCPWTPGLLLLLWLVLTGTGQTAETPQDVVSGPAFRLALEQPFAPAWDHMDLRSITRVLAEGPHIAVLLDRRLDPSVERTVHLDSGTLRDCCDRLAAECDAGAAILGSVVYLGPPATAGRLRTVVALRKAELQDLRIPESRRSVLSLGRTVVWQDLERPADLLRRLAEESRLELDGLELIPHDLWGGAILADATSVEALTLILAQFDLTFTWTGPASGVKLVPLPERVTIDRPHDPPRGVTAAAAATRWQTDVPGIEARVAGGKVTVSGTEEQHELIERLRRGERPVVKAGPPGAEQLPPLARQRYNGKIQNIPLRALLKNLETPGQGLLTFEFDPEEFQQAGIDLNRRVTFELKNARIQDLLKLALEPLGIQFELEDRTVRLKPARTP